MAAAALDTKSDAATSSALPTGLARRLALIQYTLSLTGSRVERRWMNASANANASTEPPPKTVLEALKLMFPFAPANLNTLLPANATSASTSTAAVTSIAGNSSVAAAAATATAAPGANPDAALIAYWQSRISYAGGVYVNGRPVQSVKSELPPLPVSVEYYVPCVELDRMSEYFPPFLDRHIVYADYATRTAASSSSGGGGGAGAGAGAGAGGASASASRRKHHKRAVEQTAISALPLPLTGSTPVGLLVVFKPSALPSLPPKEQNRFSLKTNIETYLTARNAPLATATGTAAAVGGSAVDAKTSSPATVSPVRVHMPSRLDWHTAGLVVLSADSALHEPLQRLFKTHKIEKSYLFQTAVNTSMKWPAEGAALLVDTPLEPDPQHSVLMRCADVAPPLPPPAATDLPTAPKPKPAKAKAKRKSEDEESEGGGGAKSAKTFFTLIGESTFADAESGKVRQSWIVRAQPITGRTHQIRVHAAALGLTIVNDTFYAGPLTAHVHGITCPATSTPVSARRSVPPLHLLSYGVQFRHPLDESKPIHVTVPTALLPDWIPSRLHSELPFAGAAVPRPPPVVAVKK